VKSPNGWTASADRAEIAIQTFTVKGTKVRLACAEGAAPLLLGFAADFHNLIEPINEGIPDDWGYAFRKVRGSDSVTSNHSSGTAIDINATDHPLGRVGTFPAEQVPMIRALAKKYGLRWGGDYRTRKDEMHFEIAVSPAAALKLIKRLEKRK